MILQKVKDYIKCFYNYRFVICRQTVISRAAGLQPALSSITAEWNTTIYSASRTAVSCEPRGIVTINVIGWLIGTQLNNSKSCCSNVVYLLYCETITGLPHYETVTLSHILSLYFIAGLLHTYLRSLFVGTCSSYTAISE